MARKHLGLNVEKALDLTRMMYEDYQYLRKRFSESKININISFLKPDIDPIIKSMECGNQVILIYSNGVFEALPPDITGGKIKEWIGVRFHKIRYWGVFPTVSNPYHPVQRASSINGNKLVEVASPETLPRDVHASTCK